MKLKNLFLLLSFSLIILLSLSSCRAKKSEKGAGGGEDLAAAEQKARSGENELSAGGEVATSDEITSASGQKNLAADGEKLTLEGGTFPDGETLTSDGEAFLAGQEGLLAEDLENLDDFIERLEQGNLQPPSSEEEEEKELTLVSKKGELALNALSDEALFPQQTEDYTVLVFANKKKIVRKFYDKNSRIIKKEDWKISDISNTKLLKTELYEYQDNSFSLKNKIIIENQTKTYYDYTDKLLLSSEKKYALYTEKDREKEALLFECFYEYDDKNRLTLEESLEYDYAADSYKKLSKVFEKKYVYKYSFEEDIPADFEYYENKVLKVKKLYTKEKGTYTNYIYFDDDYCVSVFYKNGRIVKEIYSKGNKVIRENYYE
ncbi:MAG: hypothetical protein K6D95_10295 [Treponema sp.]|nr:hypothetical protein [Treponema sp.]